MAVLHAGQNYRFKWGDFAQSTVRIHYSLDAIDFSNVIDDTAKNNGVTGEGEYVWAVPESLIGSSVTIRILDATEDDIYIDLGPYTIKEALPDDVEQMSLASSMALSM